MRAQQKAKSQRTSSATRGSCGLRLSLALLCAVGGAFTIWRFWPANNASVNSQNEASVPQVALSDADPAAAEILQRARDRVRQSPNSAEAWGRYGMLLNAYEFAANDAAACFAEASKLDPAEPRWPYYHGVVLSNSKPDEAIAQLERAVAVFGPKNTAPMLRLAELLLAQDQLDKAAQSVRKILDQEPGNLSAKLLHARLALRRGEPEQAQQLAEQAAQDPRVRKAALTLFAQASLSLGDTGSSRAAAIQAGDLPPDPAWPDPLIEEISALRTGHRAELARADLLLSQNRGAEAIKSLDGTLKKYPKSDWAWLLLGRAHLAQNDLTQAESALRKSVDLKPGSVEALYYLATVLLLNQRYDEAADWYRKALKVKPDFAMAHFNLAHCFLRQSDHSTAIEHFRQTIAAKPNYAPAHLELATLLAGQGNTTEALDEANLALKLNPNDQRTKALLQQLETR